MKDAIVLLTIGCELGILIGVAFVEVRRFIRDGRMMVLHAVNSLRSPLA